MKKLLILLALVSISSYAQQCDKVFMGMDKKDSNIKTLYTDCTHMFKDLLNIEKNKGQKLNTLALNSDDGFLESFKNISRRGLKADPAYESYNSVKEEYNQLKTQYQKYFINSRQANIKAVNDIKDSKLQDFKKQYVLGSQNNDIEISETMKFLDVVLESEKSLTEYRKANYNIAPILVNVFVNDDYSQYKNKKFNYYECRYFELALPEQNLNTLKQKLNYTCDKSV